MQGGVWTLDPEEGLADWVVADDFFVGGVGVEGAPEVDVGLLVEGDSAEEQA